MRKKIVEKKPLSEFLGVEKILDTKGLLTAMDQAVNKAGIGGVSVFFPGICELDTMYNSFQYKAVIDFAKNKKIDMEAMLKQLVPFVKKEYGRQFGKCMDPIFINFRFQKHAALITNGHLERDSSNRVMPMHIILDPFERRTFVRTLITYKTEEGLETIEDLRDQDNLQKGDVVEGFFSQLGSWVNREKTKAEVGETLGFNVVTKDSKGQINGGEKDFCLATRTCVHSEEVSENDLTAAILETYNKMKKLRKYPSCIMGIEDRLEIHLDSRRISIVCKTAEKRKIFALYLAKLLEFIGIQDLDTANVRYRKEVVVNDPWWMQVSSGTGELIATVLNFLSREKVKASVYFLMLLVGIPVFAAIALHFNHSVFRTAILMLPFALVLAESVRETNEESWLMRIGQPKNVVIPGIVLFISGIIYKELGFGAYIAVLIGVATFIAVSKTLDKIDPKRMPIWKEISRKKGALFAKLLSNTTINIVNAVLMIALGITGFTLFGILIVFSAVPAIALAFAAILLDEGFWYKMEYEKGRYNDRFFLNFKKERPTLTEHCEIRLKKTRCLKLWLWVPVKVFFRELVNFGKNKYPHFLTKTGIKERYTRFVGKNVAKLSDPKNIGGTKS